MNVNHLIFPTFKFFLVFAEKLSLIQIACTAYRTLHLEKISNYQSIILKKPNFAAFVKTESK